MLYQRRNRAGTELLSNKTTPEQKTIDHATWPLALRVWRDFMRRHLGKLVAAAGCMILVALTIDAQGYGTVTGEMPPAEAAG